MQELTPITTDGPTLHVDASPWGGGAVLFLEGQPAEYAIMRWTPEDAKALGTEIGQPAGQTAWEYAALLLAMCVWGRECNGTGLAVLGDNLASLNGLLSGRGRGTLTKLTREMAWRKVRHRWKFAAGHLPSEVNNLADALSRLSAPPGSEQKSFPEELRAAMSQDAPQLSDLWTCS